MLEDFVRVEENLRVFQSGQYEFSIEQDRQSGLWSIKNKSGPAPVALRGRYTKTRDALTDIKNWIDQAPIRAEVYKKK